MRIEISTSTVVQNGISHYSKSVDVASYFSSSGDLGLGVVRSRSVEGARDWGLGTGDWGLGTENWRLGAGDCKLRDESEGEEGQLFRCYIHEPATTPPVAAAAAGAGAAASASADACASNGANAGVGVAVASVAMEYLLYYPVRNRIIIK
ncbi:hypothetical protein HZH68_005793 [Vespula germanica]|uniref:Uncharacterized protein n=1 Tax=Vespula germanica TaxID=30212 RepID=A0A834KKF3_VESGE|nr:hypothetical protein HZH68_005793 [Vespula germanica]